DGTGLDAGELHRRVFKRFLGPETQRPIVGFTGQRAGFLGLRCRAEAVQFPRTDVVRPRAARIVWQPEPIRSENDVVAEDHGTPPVNPRAAATPSRVAATHSGALFIRSAPLRVAAARWGDCTCPRDRFP